MQVVAFQAEAAPAAAADNRPPNAWGLPSLASPTPGASNGGFAHRLIPLRIVPSQQHTGACWSRACCPPLLMRPACLHVVLLRRSMAAPPGAASGVAAHAAGGGGRDVRGGARGGRQRRRKRVRRRSGWRCGSGPAPVPRLRAAEPQVARRRMHKHRANALTVLFSLARSLAPLLCALSGRLQQSKLQVCVCGALCPFRALNCGLAGGGAGRGNTGDGA